MRLSVSKITLWLLPVAAAFVCAVPAHAVLRPTYCSMTDDNTVYYTTMFVQEYGTLDENANDPQNNRLLQAFGNAVRTQYPDVNVNNLSTAGCFGRDPKFSDSVGTELEKYRVGSISYDQSNGRVIRMVAFSAVD